MYLSQLLGFFAKQDVKKDQENNIHIRDNKKRSNTPHSAIKKREVPLFVVLKWKKNKELVNKIYKIKY